MGFYDRSKQIVITRNQDINKWVVVEPNGSHISIDNISTSMKAGEVVEYVRTRIDPAIQIGVLSEVFGPNVKSVYGEVVWMRG